MLVVVTVVVLVFVVFVVLTVIFVVDFFVTTRVNNITCTLREHDGHQLQVVFQ